MLGINANELDLILKIMNFNIVWNELFPQLKIMAQKSTTSISTIKRSLSSLIKKWLIKTERNRRSQWQFGSNNYNLDWIYNKIIELLDNEKQMSMNFDSINNESEGHTHFLKFWSLSKGLLSKGYISSPRALDDYQLQLNISVFESLIIKYLLWFLNKDGFAEVSLNYIAKILPISNSKIHDSIKSLEEKWLIKKIAQYIGKTKIRSRSIYDLNPLLIALENCEKEKIKNKLIEKWLWKSYIRRPNLQAIKKVDQDSNDLEEKIANIDLKINELQKTNFSKFSPAAEEIRILEKERSDIITNQKSWPSTIAELILKRFKNKIISEEREYSDEYKQRQNIYYEAKRICEMIGWDFDKNKPLYIKAVRVFPNSIDRYVWLTLERGRQKEKYFAKIISKKFKKYSLTK